jgi:hypothetical protein
MSTPVLEETIFFSMANSVTAFAIAQALVFLLTIGTSNEFKAAVRKKEKIFCLSIFLVTIYI